MKLPYGISLLMTCHQIYQEAVGHLYSTNTFALYDFSTMYTFSKMVSRQRMDAIRYLEIHYGPNTSIPYPHARTEQYNLPYNSDYVWEIVIVMKSLRSSYVYLEAYDGHWQHGSWPSDARQASYEIQRLGPLLGLRGLSTFRLQSGYTGFQDAVLRYESYAPAFREMLTEKAKKLRDTRVLTDVIWGLRTDLFATACTALKDETVRPPRRIKGPLHFHQAPSFVGAELSPSSTKALGSPEPTELSIQPRNAVGPILPIAC